MKLIVAIVQDKDSTRLSNSLIDADIRATKLSTTGGFLRAGNTTFLIGIDEARLDETLEIIKKSSQKREQFMTPPINLDSPMEVTHTYPIEVQVGGATVFILPIDSFYHF
ncbi:cyclic-di-AMP receptor [Ligilactobacillus sp. WILCCON 0076]|uniref:Cyclic-di-AMP receptor n=1 Tax=Ligilactobacillus ubinensis TaxID=2876789 RepID=A0A9X2FHY3_9LACO|nr:cyclic-di-AMP receptor [Ligilactobacillus ubinensis]MCP0886384.1 cyclic-di-AMP receptor [Ligilactobacillus ubinensis]